MNYFALAVLATTAVCLAYVGWEDLRYFRIRNEIVVLLTGLFLAYHFASAQSTSIYWHVAFSIVIFLLLLIPYARGALGGGDVKMLSVACLWTGLHYSLIFSCLLLVFSLCQIIAGKIGWLTIINRDGKKRMAYGPAIAAALATTLAISYFGGYN